MPALRPRKRFAQHFLKSAKVITDIIDTISPREGQCIVEVGPGEGALTRPLLQSGAQIVAVEFDRDAAKYLVQHLSQYPNLKLLNQDFLDFDPARAGLTSFTLVGNLPYNITSPVIDWTVRHRDLTERACLMVQKEVGARLAAQPNHKDWSPLSIFTQLHYRIERCFDIPPRHFRPPPRIMSTFIVLIRTSAPEIAHPILFEKVVRASFRQRRKLLVNNLVPDIVATPQAARDILEETGLPPRCRAEQVSTAQFLTLTERLVQHNIL
ncbi:MAG: 16S rRNA (adenine(1518)-N(6)/adenine(1519)-N(6))-dimethyltransferase RsmA [bacterium]